MSEGRDELLARVRRALGELGLSEVRIPEGWNYKLAGKVVAFAGKKRALSQVSMKLSPEEAQHARQRVDVEPHPVARLAAANWVTINVYDEEQLAFILQCVQSSIEQTGAKSRDKTIKERTSHSR